MEMSEREPSRLLKEAAHALEERHCRELIEGIARREQNAIAEFYDVTISRVYAVALRITTSPEMAEETVSDVYFQVWKQAERFDAARGSVLTWLLTICRSRAIDYLRRRDRAELHPNPENLRPDLMASEDDPQNLLAAIERNIALYATLETLTPLQRQLISLAFFRGYSHQEISHHTGLPLGSVKSHIRKALHALHQLLDPPDKSSLQKGSS